MDTSPESSVKISSLPPNIPPPPKPTHKLIFLLGGLIILSGIFGGYYLVKSNSKPPQNACTMEAKLCPDGSSVNRTGPNCEFTPCPKIQTSPTISEDNSNWRLYSDPKLRYSFRYPATFFKYIDKISENAVQIGAIEGGREIKKWDSSRPDSIYINVIVAEKESFNFLGEFNSLEEFDEKNTERHIIPYFGGEKRLIVVDGINGDLITKESPPIMLAVVMTKQTIYQIMFLANKKDNLINNKPLFDQILSTFKFLDK